MGSVLGSFGAFQGNIWSVAPFIPVGLGENGLKKHQKNYFFDFPLQNQAKLGIMTVQYVY